MTIPTFDDRLRTGYAEIDEQHEWIFKLAARVEGKIGACSPETVDESFTGDQSVPAECMDDAVADAVYGLVDYATEHFADEETLMTDAGFPQAQVHAALHAELSEHVGSYLMRLIGEEPVVAGELVEFLISWLQTHIEREDRSFTEWLSRDMPR